MKHLTIASLRAIRSIFLSGMFGIIGLSILLTITALVMFVIGSGMFLSWASAHWLHGEMAQWLPLLGSVGAFVLALCLFPGIMPLIVSFFDDRIARVIERDEYPDNAPIYTAPFWPELLHDIRFALMALLLNIIALPLYLFIPAPILFYPLNGYLLGREFFVMAARRHLPVQDAEALRRRHHGTILLAGMALTLMATIPLLNLLAPFWGVAVMVHLYHRLAPPALIQVIPPY
jgi:CysZ protein